MPNVTIDRLPRGIIEVGLLVALLGALALVPLVSPLIGQLDQHLVRGGRRGLGDHFDAEEPLRVDRS